MRALCLAVLVSLALASPLRAQDADADATQRPRALVLVRAAEGSDLFTTAWLFEVAARVLRDAGWDVPPRAAAADLLPAATCTADDGCLADIARSAHAPVLLMIELAGEGDARSVTLRALRFSLGASERLDEGVESGDGAALAERVRSAATRSTSRPAPCAVELAGAARAPRVSVDGTPVEAPFFVEPGAHRLRIEAAERAPHDGELTCEAGRRYRIVVD